MLLLLMPFWLLLSINHPENLDAVYGVFLLKSMPGRQTWLIEIIIKSVIGLQLLIYLGFGIKLYKDFSREMSSEIYGELKLYINGIQIFAISFVILMLLLISHRFIHETGDSVSSTLFVLALLILNIGLAYFGIRFDDNELHISNLTPTQKAFETQNKVMAEAAIKTAVPEKKYQSSCLCDDLKEELIASLLFLMKEQEPFTNSRIRIEDIAELAGTNTKYLSQLINEHFGKNFHAFLNDYRCAKVVKLFHDPNFDDYSIEGIAETCGFNSRSTFVASFKKFSGKLPSEYRNSIHIKSKR
ncbi:MAG: helix-turn-helix domain-containing protein [Bacteroidales bacterium]|jgi:AraC-like DNA-binding protein|nr:helix-turn-helix domain-containing protein [Bacteroidales bacterium]